MNKKIIYSAILMLPVFIMAKMPNPMSFGAPVSSSGAPDEVTCATSGCHDDNLINKGNAILSVKVGDDVKKYIPGQTYPITVRIGESSVYRFGFQLVALKDNDHLNAGTITITDPARTQLLSNDIALQDRKYATYTYQGTEPFAPGVGEWTVNWTAPEQNVGPVTLYIASVSANNDNSDKGDRVYTTSINLSPDEQTSIKENNSDLVANVFVNGFSKELTINMQLQHEKQVKCAIYNIEGRLMKVLFDEKITSIDKKFELDAPTGIYLVKLISDKKEKTTKIVIQ